MLETFLAIKYLIPRKRSLSAALISILSIFVISLVVWLILVFLSVTTGLETNWIKKLTHLNAPLRIMPTDTYYSSFYYRIDSISSSSEYTNKTIKEKALALTSNPYRKDTDMPIPAFWLEPDLDKQGNFIDPVKELYALLKSDKEITFQDYEISSALLKLTLERTTKNRYSLFEDKSTNYLNQMSYLLSYPEKNPSFQSLFCCYRSEDIHHILQLPNILPPPIFPTMKDTTNIDDYLNHLEGVSNEIPFNYDQKITLPNINSIALPKSFQKSGVLIGDKGYLSYSGMTPTSTQEQRIPIIVSAFYDPGLLPMGSRFILVDQSLTKLINSFTNTLTPDGNPTNGIFVWFDNYKKADEIKTRLQKTLHDKGLSSFWKIQTYKEFEFSKDLLQQFQSDRLLFTLIAGIILIVACSNIISLLILLVNDKKKEIATLQALGATKTSIITIFGFCGIFMGLISLVIGSVAAFFTLQHLDLLVSFLSSLQGHSAFNEAFFGSHLPNQFSMNALIFILIATPIISLVAGVIPALKASRVHPSKVLRS